MKKFYKKGHLARRGKRWPALLMSICLIGTMLPVTARAEPDRVVSSNILSDYNTSFEGANDAGDLWWWNDASWGQTNIPRRAYGEAAKPAADCGDYYVQANPANIGDKAQCQIVGEGIAALIKGGKTYEYSYYAKLAEGEIAGTVTLSVIGDWMSSAVVTPDKEVTLNADEWQKVTGTFTLASDASQVVVRFEGTEGVSFCLDDLRVAEEPIPVTLSGVTCGNRAYNAAAYSYTGTPVWKTADGTAVTGETSVTYYKVDNVSDDMIAYIPLTAAPTDAGSYQAVFTIISDDYVGTARYSFEITKAPVTVAAKNKSIYVGDAVPSLENPTAGTDYTVTGLCGTDALGGTVSMSYGQEPDNTKAGTYEILISGLTAPEGDNYTLTFTNAELTIATKLSGGGNTDSGGSSGGSAGSAAGGVADQPADSDNTTTTTNKDGSTTTTTTETDANGNTVTTTTTVETDGSTTEKVQANADEIIPGEKLYIYKLNTKTGKYTMVNAGTATVKAVVTLKNGTKKTVKMTIKVN